MKKDKKHNKGKKGIEVVNTPIIPIPERFEEIHHEQDSTNKSENGGKENQKLKWYNEKNAAWAGVVVNFLMLFITFLLLNSTRKTIDESNKLFTVQNMPFLQVTDLKLSGDTMFYSIVNLGQYPVKIVSGKFGLQPLCMNWAGINKNNPAASSIETSEVPKDYQPNRIYLNKKTVYIPIGDTTVINLYAIKETPIPKFKVGFVQQSILKNEIKWDADFMKEEQYFFGEIIYENPKLGIKGSYVFNVLISGWPNPTFQFILNENN